MKRLACLFTLAATVAMPGVALAQPTPELKVSGYDRVRLMSQLGYDLDAAAVQDNSVFFADIRSFLTLEARLDQAAFVSSFDLAGTDFDQGAIMGYDNPARQRLFDVKVRHLYLSYDFPIGLSATLGRQPARLGNGIVSAINRDAFKLVQALGGGSNMTGVWVRGGKGNSNWADHLPVPADQQAQAGRSGINLTNDPDGAWHELNAFVLAYNMQPLPGSKVQVFAAQQVDLSSKDVYPQKRYADVNGEVKLGDLTLGGEAIYLGGESPAGAAGSRTPLNSFALLFTSKYQAGPWQFGLMAGRGGGDNDPGDGQNANFQSLFIDESSFMINNLFGNDLWGFNGTDAGIGRGAGLANVTFLQPNVSYRFTPEVTGSLSYTKHLATAPQKAGSGILGTVATPHTALATNIGDEVDLGMSWKWGATTFYGIGSTFVPGDVFAATGFGNAAHKLELGTEFKF